jgi:hypothetical protein
MTNAGMSKKNNIRFIAIPCSLLPGMGLLSAPKLDRRSPSHGWLIYNGLPTRGLRLRLILINPIMRLTAITSA